MFRQRVIFTFSMRIFSVIFCIIIGSVQLGIAQIDNTLLEQSISIKDSTSDQVSLAVESRSFFKNNEYFGKLTTGYTLMGTQLATQLAYQPSPFVRLQGGVYLLSDFGNNSLRKVSPIFTLKMQKNGYSLLFGTLEGNLSHRLIEPLYNYERYTTNQVENGVQIKVDKANWWSDTWMNWEVMQYLQSSYQEQFSAGHSTQLKLVSTPKFKFTIPIQFLFTHKGGQIDTVNSPLETIVNAAVGFSAVYQSSSFIKQIGTHNYYTIYKDLSPTKMRNYQGGNGVFINAEALARNGMGVSIGYWSGFQYYAGRGGFLYQSLASDYGLRGYQEQRRNLAFFRALYQKNIYHGLSVDFRFEPYYDISNSLFEYSYSLYLTYKNDFKIINLKNRK